MSFIEQLIILAVLAAAFAAEEANSFSLSDEEFEILGNQTHALWSEYLLATRPILDIWQQEGRVNQ